MSKRRKRPSKSSAAPATPRHSVQGPARRTVIRPADPPQDSPSEAGAAATKPVPTATKPVATATKPVPAAKQPSPAAKPVSRQSRNEPVVFRQTLQLRARPDLVFRQIFDPTRRARWDKGLRSARYLGDEGIQSGHEVEYVIAARLLRWRMRGQYQGVKSPLRGSVVSVGRVGALDSMRHDWTLKSIPGGTEVTFVQTAQVRHAFARAALERVLLSMGLKTVMGLQRAVDLNAAEASDRQLRALQQKNAPRRQGLARRGLARLWPWRR